MTKWRARIVLLVLAIVVIWWANVVGEAPQPTLDPTMQIPFHVMEGIPLRSGLGAIIFFGAFAIVGGCFYLLLWVLHLVPIAFPGLDPNGEN